MNWQSGSLIFATVGILGSWTGLAGQSADKQPLAEDVFKNIQVLKGIPVSEFMTPNPEAVRPTDTLAFVLHKMDGGGYRHLPVAKDGRPLGMVSVRDMLRHITRLCSR